MNIKKWFSDQSFLKKFILIYVVCAAIPMLLMMIYSYQQTSKLLIDQAYSDLRQNVTAMENSLNYAYQPYETIMRTLSNDRLVNTQLTLDYTNLSYSDIAYYQNTTLSELEVLNPGLAWIRFYSSNKTLPNDHYLSPLEELGEGPAQSADALRGQAAISGYALERGEDTIVMLSRMNYYSTDAIKNYLALGIHRSLVAEQLHQNSSGRKVYLLDTSGRVLISSDGSLDLQPMTDILPNWESLPLGQIQRQTAGGSDLLCLRTELDTPAQPQPQAMGAARRDPRRGEIPVTRICVVSVRRPRLGK